MDSKYGKIKSWETIFREKIDSRIKDYEALIQICEREKTKIPTIQVYIKHTPISNKHNASSWAPSYNGMRALILAFVSVYGKEKVERELGVKITERSEVDRRSK